MYFCNSKIFLLWFFDFIIVHNLKINKNSSVVKKLYDYFYSKSKLETKDWIFI